ncbi:MAG: ATP-binding protein [Chloracidobacterium sp.]|uniref:Signal transduction histidine-protein kinase/phosphatase MprB n=1 Tax=Chloracidobacterium validum TaxID=2821543 RepID=A0ABX8B8U2_9BACT|nr:ATP-binding protein [Chloracidobacterium validum]QUW02050.1 HAMP domain-containing protein [Chloracidobacterium validum]
MSTKPGATHRRLCQWALRMPRYLDLRFRLATLLSVVIIGMVAVLYELNRRAERQILAQVEAQTAQLTTALELGLQSISTSDYLDDFIRSRQLTPKQLQRIRRIAIVDANGLVTDSTLRAERGQHIHPPSDEALVKEGDPLAASDAENGLARTIFIPFQALGKDGSPERNYVVVTISAQTLTETIAQTSRQRLLVTGSALLAALVVAVALVWRFTQPIGELVKATRRIEEGDLDVRLTLNRRDEIGLLAERFNAMVARLREARDLEREAVVGRLTSGIAHEIRNPLNFINLTMDHVRTRHAPSDPTERATFERLTTAVKDEIARLNTLVTNVLRVGRPAILALRPVKLSDLIAAVLDVARSKAEAQQIELICVDDTQGTTIEADADSLKSCFSNLVINAIEAMPNGGRLRIHIRDTSTGQLVEVSDTGTGISRDELKHIFDPYFSTKETGIGLGLAVTRQIVTDHGGTIEPVSHPGQGTTFIVRLPFRRMLGKGAA